MQAAEVAKQKMNIADDTKSISNSDDTTGGRKISSFDHAMNTLRKEMVSFHINGTNIQVTNEKRATAGCFLDTHPTVMAVFVISTFNV